MDPDPYVSNKGFEQFILGYSEARKTVIKNLDTEKISPPLEVMSNNVKKDSFS